jgi:hypothetical protein
MTAVRFLPCFRPQERRLVPHELTLARDIRRHFLCVLRTEPGSPLDEGQTCFQRGAIHSGVQSDADIYVHFSYLRCK